MNKDKMELEEAIKLCENLINCLGTGLAKFGETIDLGSKDIGYIQAIETVLKEIEYVKNDEQKAMEILKQNSIGRYKKEENGTISHIIAVEDFKKILHLIDTQEIKLKNSIPKKKIENEIELRNNIITN